MGTQTWNNLDIQKRTSSSCLSQNPVEVSGGFPVDFTVILIHYFSETTSQNARQKHTYPFFSSSKVSSWPSAFILTSALNGCCVPKRRRLLLAYNHNYEHIQKHKWFPWKLQLTLNHFSPPPEAKALTFRPGVLGREGTGCGGPQHRHTDGTP